MAVYTFNLSDTLAFSDSTPIPPRQRATSDFINFTDSATFKANPTRYSISDILNFSDLAQVIGKRVWYTPVSETLGFTDSAIGKNTISRQNVSETLTFNEITTARNLSQKLIDTLTFADSTRSNIVFTPVSESITFTDNVTYRINRFVVADTLAFTESIINRFSIRNLKVSDTLVFNEIVQARLSLYHMADRLTFNDVAGFSYTRSVSDTINFVDSATVYRGGDIQSLSDMLVFTDSIAMEQSKPSSESVQFNEGVCVCLIRNRSLIDSLNFSDYATVRFSDPNDPRNSSPVTLYPQPGFTFTMTYNRAFYDRLSFKEKLIVLKNNVEVHPEVPDCCK